MQYTSMFILGRQPAIGRAELESLLGAIQPVGEQAVACDIAAGEIDFARIGSATRLAKVLTPLDTTNWPAIARYLTDKLPEHLDYLPEGKLKLGLSVFDLPVKPQQLFRTGLELKKVCKHAGRSVRLVPNTELALSSAQVLHNQLTGELGMELLLIRDGHKTWLAQTVKVQDITAYARRDQGRPKRDARVGMLPPKLAQTIVNLATGPLPAGENNVVLDPFCGTGVVLQEALLMGYGAYGSDLEPRMIDYSRENLEWLTTHHGKELSPALEVGDATDHRWPHAFSAVASETYLGRPLSSWPGADTLHDIIGTCNVILEKFLTNLAEQTKPGFRLCVAVPAWRGPNGQIRHLPLLDHLGQLGYNRLRFEHAKDADLVYFRPEQLVARELLVITRK
jgi:tRNA (guanine10-N2)-dimethyltransferase